jgi:predicted metal-dependent HD superfamily phosphohydrolase
MLLAGEASQWLSYEQAIRFEFANLPEAAYWEGRRSFLEKTLASKAIYQTTEAFNSFEKKARKNISHALF